MNKGCYQKEILIKWERPFGWDRIICQAYLPNFIVNSKTYNFLERKSILDKKIRELSGNKLNKLKLKIEKQLMDTVFSSIEKVLKGQEHLLGKNGAI